MKPLLEGNWIVTEYYALQLIKNMCYWGDCTIIKHNNWNIRFYNYMYIYQAHDTGDDGSIGFGLYIIS